MERAPVSVKKLAPKLAIGGLAAVSLVGALKYVDSMPGSNGNHATATENIPKPQHENVLKPNSGPCLTPEQNLKIVKASLDRTTSNRNQNIENYAYYPTGQEVSVTTTSQVSTDNPKNLTSYAYYPTGEISKNLSANHQSVASSSENCPSPVLSGINIELIKQSHIFTSEQIAQLIANSGVYAEVAKKYNLPWQLLATVHWRETNLSMINPGNDNGLFQVYDSYFRPGRISQGDFVSQVENAARLLATDYSKKAHISSRVIYKNEVNVVDVGNLLMAYNGQSSYYYQQAKEMGFHDRRLGFLGSPYVSNLINRNFDSRFNGNWKQIRYDNGYALPADLRPGTLPVFILLMQATEPSIKLNFSGLNKSLSRDLIKRF